ncbi:MAG: hypothetical protein WCK82_11200 [Bacteroidota bacterium]|jgi:hypothetical protein
MAILQGMCTSFKVGMLSAQFNFATGTTQVFKIALYTSTADLSTNTSAYTTSGEITGTGYVAGGATLSISQVPTSSGTTAYLNFANVTWAGSSLTARGALIYLANGTTNPAIAVLDFGADKTMSPFVVQFPVSDASNAIIRFA